MKSFNSMRVLAKANGYEIGKTDNGFLYLISPNGEVNLTFENVFDMLHTITDGPARWALAAQVTATYGGVEEESINETDGGIGESPDQELTA